MRRLAVFATMVAALALPVWAQRVAPHGGAPGHGGPAPRSFAPPASSFSSRAPMGVRPSPVQRGFATSHPIGIRPAPAPRGFNYASRPIRPGSANRPVARMPYTHSTDHSHGPWDGDHHHHRGVYWGGYVYPYYGYNPWLYAGPIFTGYVDPWLFAPDNYDDSGANGGYVASPYRDYGMQTSQPYPQEYYEGEPAAVGQAFGRGSSSMAQSDLSGGAVAAMPAKTVTVIFNDGRPPEQIHNYLLTANTLTVFDPAYHEIPLAQVDVVATEQANRAAGVDFRVPVKR